MESHYLYASKETRTLNEIRVSVFNLSFPPVQGTITVQYAGLVYWDWFVENHEFHFVHRDPMEWDDFLFYHYADPIQKPWIDAGFIGSPDTVIYVTYQHLEWNSGTESFDSVLVTDAVTVDDDEYARYYRTRSSDSSSTTNWIPGSSTPWASTTEFHWYVPRNSPVVVTDDDVQNYDQRGVQNEFSVDPLTGEVAFFPSENLVQNSAFLINHASTNNALAWSVDPSTTGIVPMASTAGTYPVYGSMFAPVPISTNIYQNVRLRSNTNHHISFYGRVPAAAGSVKLTVNPLDVMDVYRDSSNTPVGNFYDSTVEVFSQEYPLSSTQWTRIDAYVGEDNAFYDGSGTALGTLPANTTGLEVRVAFPSTSGYLDAVQVHEGAFTAPYLGISPKSTIEYEVNPSGVYQPNPSSTVYGRDEVDINPLTSAKANGYLVWMRDGTAPNDFQLGKGSDGTTYPTIGRKHIPFAKTSGVSKLVDRQTFHRDGVKIADDLSRSAAVIAAADAQPEFPENGYIDTLGRVHLVTKLGVGSELNVLFYDQFENPLIKTSVTITLAGAVVYSTTTRTTDLGGRARYSFTPTSPTITGVSVETVEFAVGSVTHKFYVDVF